MVRLEKHGDSAVRFIFTDSDHYLYKDGVVDVPVNSLSLVIDESEMVTFKKASTADPFISFRLDKSNFSSRDELLTFYKENMVGAGGISEEEVQTMIDAATSGIPSSEVVEQLQTDVSNLQGETNDIWDTIDEKEEVIASALTQLNQDVADIDAKEEVIASALTEVNLALDNKLDASAYTPTDLSQYWTSGQTQEAINAATSGIPSSQVVEQLRTDINTVSGDIADKQDKLVFYSEAEYDEEAGTEATAQIYVLGQGDSSGNGAGVNVQPYTAALFASSEGEDPMSTTLVVTSDRVAINEERVLTEADLSAVTAVSNDLNTLSGAVIDNEYTVSQAINSLNNRVTAVESGGTGGGITSGEVQTMIDDSLDIYWTSAQTQTAIDGVKAYYVNGNVWLTQGITDADWDGLIAAMNAHRPINATIGQTLYTCESIYLESATILWFTASDGANLYSYRIEKNGSNDYALTYNTKTVAELSEVQAVQRNLSENINSVNSSLTAHTADTTVHVTQAEKNVWNTKQDALTAGRGILINAGFISTPTAVLGQGGTVGVMQIIKLTQTEYDALATKDAQTLYIVVD